MTEKRFRLGADFDGFNNIYDNERTIGCERTIYATKMVKLLNELHEDNLKLEKENKELKYKYDEQSNEKMGLEEDIDRLLKDNKELKASLYAEKTNTAEVVNDYAKQFKRHSTQFSFMIDLAEDLGVDVRKLEALDD